MARYSSESDSDHNSRYRRRRSRRSRSSSSDSSDSSSHRRRSSKHSKTKRRYRSHSRSRGRDRDHSQKSYRGSRNSSSKGRERHRYHSKSRSSDRSKRKARSASREKSGSRSSSSQSNVKTNVPEKPKNVVIKDDFPIEPRFKEGVLDEINSEGFAPKQFVSSNAKEKKFKNIVIDITADTIQVPTVADVPSGSESVFHSSIMLDQEARFDKWVKKLYTLRQKAIVDLIHSNVI
ncbi:zinc finger Ran-binding domain-containing protein 2-like [Hylaeus anthracinus]|uniref:zinc finger Ran-binding domain-containing protein 2-like n=1 Tax=Hylaeus volcanicus TaxID=313075 RepID=UPI0023B82837|nr:zinc finger Ran-binding domain-containing protein 2-like [Hylaeus volcanicus]XP_054014830.1 zinc finger Ran-binding domain-containing protein 2-like [Hylaeus anthracinus]